MAYELPEDTWPFEVRTKFAPALCSDSELDYLHDHVGESPTVAFARDDEVSLSKKGVSPHVVRAVLGRLRELEELNKVYQSPWCGYEAVKESIAKEKQYRAKLEEMKRVNPAAAKHPTMYKFTASGRPLWQGAGSDRGRPRLNDLDLVPTDQRGATVFDWTGSAPREAAPEEVVKADTTDAHYRLIEGDNYYECPIKGCNKRTEFDPGSETSRNIARGGMARHMLMTKLEIEAHRAAHTECFK